MNFLPWTVSKTIRETRHAITLVLDPADKQLRDYQAGQFLSFIFTDHHHEVRRAYSFSSTPGVDEQVAITVQRIPNGNISRQLVQVKPGTQLLSLPPAGRFTIPTQAQEARHYFFIAAGSGITPIFSLLKQLLTEEPQSTICLIDQNHDEETIIFNRSLQALAAKHRHRFEWISLLSEPRQHPNESARLNNNLLEELVRERLSATADPYFYLCGPPGYMRMALFTLTWMGIDESRIRRENFVVDFMPPVPPVRDTSPKQVQVSIRGIKYHFPVQYPKNILQAALDHQVPMPYSCRGGRCSSCAAYCLSGKMVMSINEVLTEEDMKKGLVLTCVGYALSDLTLRID